MDRSARLVTVGLFVLVVILTVFQATQERRIRALEQRLSRSALTSAPVACSELPAAAREKCLDSRALEQHRSVEESLEILKRSAALSEGRKPTR